MGDAISLQSLLDLFSAFLAPFMVGVESILKLFFNDLPTFGGLSLGWWFLIAAFIPKLIGAIIGGDND